MSTAIENLEAAFQRAVEIRPEVGGFPYLAETPRVAGIAGNIWYLPACQSLYLTEFGPVVTMGAPSTSGTVDVPTFAREALIVALRTGQAGNSTFPEFLAASWRAGVFATMLTSPYALSRVMGPRLKSVSKPILLLI
jgi:uncharacterized protein YbcV (DUF1398 family)